MAGGVTYSDLLRDPRWQRCRLEILSRDGFRCRFCSAADRELHVHHCYYEKGKAPWEYPDWSMLTACADCHETIEQNMKELRLLIARAVSLGLLAKIIETMKSLSVPSPPALHPQTDLKRRLCEARSHEEAIAILKELGGTDAVNQS